MSTDKEHRRAIPRVLRDRSSKGSGRHAPASRGPDREVRRDSYDVDDQRVKPWVSMGTTWEGLAHREALLQTAHEQRLRHWRDF